MNLSEDVDLEDYVSRPEKISGAEISCIVQEAGMQAVRNNRCVARSSGEQVLLYGREGSVFLVAVGGGGSCLIWQWAEVAVASCGRYVVLPKDFEKGYKANTQKNDKDFEFYK